MTGDNDESEIAGPLWTPPQVPLRRLFQWMLAASVCAFSARTFGFEGAIGTLAAFLGIWLAGTSAGLLYRAMHRRRD